MNALRNRGERKVRLPVQTESEMQNINLDILQYLIIFMLWHLACRGRAIKLLTAGQAVKAQCTVE